MGPDCRQNVAMSRSSIEWTDETWNPVTGCEKVSPGCKHCYAERFAERFRGVSGHPYEHGFDPQLRPDRVEQPRGWKTPRMVFVNSMSDLFGDFVPDAYLAKVFKVMRETPQHTYQILTKRAERLETWTRSQLWLSTASNIWLGVSVEDRKYGVPRIAHLQRANAACRFLSVEPLLEALGRLDLAGIDWVIVGGESGPGARPMELEWVRSVRDQCITQRVSFFFKQWGGVRKDLTGRELHGRTFDEMPQPLRRAA